MRDDPHVTDLVTRARKGDQQAWDALVERYAPLIWSICRHYRLSRADAQDVGQGAWLQFVNHLGAIRDPAALPGWLTTTTKRECSRVVRAARGPQAAGQFLDESIPDKQITTAEQELLDVRKEVLGTASPGRRARLSALPTARSGRRLGRAGREPANWGCWRSVAASPGCFRRGT
jgi:DNA-directed RNA polymerase specialized sigma24 family protein